MSNDWSSGYQAWLDTHQGVDDDMKMQMYFKCWNNFDLSKFQEHYNNLSVDEWKDVISDMSHKGYDIRSVLFYKKLDGENFRIDFRPEIYYPLLKADGSDGYLTEMDGFGSEGAQEKENMRRELVERYKSFGLPIPEYWGYLWV